MASPQYASETSPGSVPGSAQPTPTFKSTPSKNILAWTTEDVANFVDGLGLPQYRDAWLGEEVVGEALIYLDQELLGEMGITSVGHRLQILKAVYQVKVAQEIPIEPDHYIPNSVGAIEGNPDTTFVTVADFQRLVTAIKQRDDKVFMVENELRRVNESFTKLREELLPIFKMVKNETKPLPPTSGTLIAPSSFADTLPTPNHNMSQSILQMDHNDRDARENTRDTRTGSRQEYSEDISINRVPTPQPAFPRTQEPSRLSRKHSKKTLFLNSLNNNSSQRGQISPTHSTYQTENSMDAIANSQSGMSTAIFAPPNSRDYPNTSRPTDSNASTLIPTSPPTSSLGRSLSTSHTHTSSSRYGHKQRDWNDEPSSSGSSRGHGRAGINSMASPPTSKAQPATVPEQDDTGGAPPRTVEIFKSFRVSMDDPCYKVLPAALKRYNIQADWQHYALYIVYGDQERCLGLDEKPLILFKQLDKEGKKPMFMLRKHASPETGHIGGVVNGGGTYKASDGTNLQSQPPGGVL